MIRKIITIDEEKCNGCGACAAACHEGAIGMVEGKAKLLRDDYCDGLGDCLPACPMEAITFTEREADAYNEAAVLAVKAAKALKAESELRKESGATPLPCGCPGSAAHAIDRSGEIAQEACETQASMGSQLGQWPVQIKLLPVKAPYYQGADLLIAADCTAYAYGNFHQDFIRNHVTMVGCPKLDEGDYTEKLTAILSQNEIQSVTIVRMEVPCCGGLEHAAKNAIQASGKSMPWQVVTISTDGKLLP